MPDFTDTNMGQHSQALEMSHTGGLLPDQHLSYKHPPKGIYLVGATWGSSSISSGNKTKGPGC